MDNEMDRSDDLRDEIMDHRTERGENCPYLESDREKCSEVPGVRCRDISDKWCKKLEEK